MDEQVKEKLLLALGKLQQFSVFAAKQVTCKFVAFAKYHDLLIEFLAPLLRPDIAQHTMYSTGVNAEICAAFFIPRTVARGAEKRCIAGTWRNLSTSSKRRSGWKTRLSTD